MSSDEQNHKTKGEITNNREHAHFATDLTVLTHLNGTGAS
jgi:hypothetical protein